MFDALEAVTVDAGVVYDVVVLGGGYAGFAATLALSERGSRVLLLEPSGDLVWESGRCFVPTAGDCPSPIWHRLMNDLRSRGGFDGQSLEGAMAEVSATCMLQQSSADVLYYAHPVALEFDRREMARSVIVATRSGLRRIVAHRFVDASEDAALLRLSSRHTGKPTASLRQVFVYAHRRDWGSRPNVSSLVPTQRWAQGPVRAEETTNQAVMQLIDGLDPSWRDAVISHVSVVPFPVYHSPGAPLTHVANIACAVPGYAPYAVRTPADRMQAGLDAADRVRALPGAEACVDDLQAPIRFPRVERSLRADVLVAGAGTGGAIAAIAAAREGASVCCADALDYPGGIGVGGGIHSYYYGISGGLYESIDEETSRLVKAHGRLLQAHPVNPIAKLCALETHFRRAGVRFLPRSFVFSTTGGERVDSATLITPDGLLKMNAKVFIDGTGDGDLCAAAGAEFTLGRDSDQRLHAFSQVSYGISERANDVLVFSRNFDAGWCDPTDSTDLTRARLSAIAQHQIDQATPKSRLIQLAPQLGLRQGRQICTDVVQGLADQLCAVPGSDTIGYAGANQDTHFVDFPMESDETVFWLSLCRGWFTPLAYPLRYPMLLPRGLKNVGIASRCLGVTQDAHYGLRMMRDVQRIGEAIGYAAAMMARRDLPDLRDVPMTLLQSKLTATGAFPGSIDQIKANWAKPPLAQQAQSVNDQIADAMAQFDEGKSGRALWVLMRHRERTESHVLRTMRESSNANARWFAAGIAAKWGLADAEAPLIDAIEQRSNGLDERLDTHGRPYDAVVMRTMPNWLTALTMLRMCGSNACLDTLQRLIASHTPSQLTVLALLTTLDRLLERGAVTDRARVEQIVARIDLDTVLDQTVPPQAMLGLHADNALHHKSDRRELLPWPFSNTESDHRDRLERLVRRVLDRLHRAAPHDPAVTTYVARRVRMPAATLA